LDAAVAAAEEALAAYQPDAPGTDLASLQFTLGAILRDAGRSGEAEPHYQAILDDPDSTPFGRKVAYQGLAWSALDRDDTEAAGRHAKAAVRLAETLGDDALTGALDVFIEACRAGGDLDAAWQAATRLREATGRIGGHNRPYFAVRAALDVALDRGNLAVAEDLLAELDGHAAALDADTRNTAFADEVAQRRERLNQLQTPP
jgi:hypothetical protein